MKAHIKKEETKKVQSQPKEFTEMKVDREDKKITITAVGHNSPKMCAAISFAMITLAQNLERLSVQKKIKNFTHNMKEGDSSLSCEIITEYELEAFTVIDTIITGLILLWQSNPRKMALTGNIFGGTLEEQYKSALEDLKVREKLFEEKILNQKKFDEKRAETKKQYEKWLKEHPGHGTDEKVISQEFEEFMQTLEK